MPRLEKKHLHVLTPDPLRQIVKAWASLDMVQHYAQMVGEDLFQSHKAHFPIDNF
jgi:hypothetical protein